MALFAKNPNESAYVGGKKNWADVIKNSGPGDLLIWRQPEEDFNTNSTLIVMPGEEAIFIKGGNIEKTFEDGTYKLSTENYPFISRLRNAFTGGISTFNCVVYFIRKAHSMEILWGTSIEAKDKVLGLPATLKSRGSYKVQVSNAEICLTKLLGNNVDVLSPDDLENYFSNQFTQYIKSCIARTLNESTEMLFGVDSRLTELSEQVTPFLTEILLDYGIKLANFSISALDPDEEIKQQYKQAGLDAIGMRIRAQGAAEAKMLDGQADASIKIMHGQADRSVMDALGEGWGKQQAANILGTLAANPGSGGIAAVGAGLGMGMTAGGVFGNMAQQMFTPMQQQPTPYTAPQPSGRFTQKSAETPQASTEDPVATLKKLKDMLDLGLIEQAEFNAKKTEIMNRM